jgi:hypothetical protein
MTKFQVHAGIVLRRKISKFFNGRMHGKEKRMQAPTQFVQLSLLPLL